MRPKPSPGLGCDIQLRRHRWERGNAHRARSAFSGGVGVAEAGLATAASEGPLEPRRRGETLPQRLLLGTAARPRWGCTTCGFRTSVGTCVFGETVDQIALWDFSLELLENIWSLIGMFWSGSVNGVREEQCCAWKPSVFSDIPVPSA